MFSKGNFIVFNFLTTGAKHASDSSVVWVGIFGGFLKTIIIVLTCRFFVVDLHVMDYSLFKRV